MILITRVDIISIDKSEENWAIEGEILFEDDLTSTFSVSYNSEYDELEDLEIEIVPGKYDATLLKEMIVDSAMGYDE